jgi:hypothetical protein
LAERLLATPLGGNLAIYYRDFGYSGGLVILGKIDGNVEAFNSPGSVRHVDLVK